MVPIPTSALEVTTKIVPSLLIPKVFAVPIWNFCSGFVVPIPTRPDALIFVEVRFVMVPLVLLNVVMVLQHLSPVKTLMLLLVKFIRLLG